MKTKQQICVMKIYIKTQLQIFRITSHPKLNKEEIESLNKASTSSKIEAVIKTLLKNKSPEPVRFTNEFCQTFKDKLVSILQKLSQKIKAYYHSTKANTKIKQR